MCVCLWQNLIVPWWSPVRLFMTEFDRPEVISCACVYDRIWSSWGDLLCVCLWQNLIVLRWSPVRCLWQNLIVLRWSPVHLFMTEFDRPEVISCAVGWQDVSIQLLTNCHVSRLLQTLIGRSSTDCVLRLLHTLRDYTQLHGPIMYMLFMSHVCFKHWETSHNSTDWSRTCFQYLTSVSNTDSQ